VDVAAELRKQTRMSLTKTQKQLEAARAKTNAAAFREEQAKRVRDNRHIVETVNTLIFKDPIFVTAQQPKAAWLELNPAKLP
jgi:hypothetical protein